MGNVTSSTEIEPSCRKCRRYWARAGSDLCGLCAYRRDNLHNMLVAAIVFALILSSTLYILIRYFS